MKKKMLGFLLRGIFLVILVSYGYADNPIVTHVYTADPSGFVANGRLYVITTHDQNNATDYSQLYDYYLFSSADLVTWQDHGIVFNARSDTSWANLAYAPDMAYRNGKYYLFFPDGGSSIGVAVGDSPEGPFTDNIGRPLIDKNTPNSNVQWCFDPGIFIDDDGQAYCYFGGGGPGNARVIKVNSDMTGVSGAAVTIDAPNFFEASYMHKRDGIYYFSYSTDGAGGMSIDYMTSSDPMSGFQHRGTILANPWSNLGNNNHHSIVEYNGQWYIFYHNRAVSNSVYQRSVCLDRLYYNSDGTIQRVNASQAGVPPVTPGTPGPTIPPSTPDPNNNIIVRAMGTQAGGILELHVDGSVVESWTLSTNMADYSANSTGGIELHFINDDNVDSGLDVQVDYIRYNGTILEAEDQEINTAVWQDDSCGGSYSEMMHCAGYIRFNTGGPSDPPVPTQTPPGDGSGLVSFGSSSYMVAPGAALNADVVVNTGTQDLAAYGITVIYNSSYLFLDESLGTSGVSEGSRGFVAAVNPEPGLLTISGFDAAGTGPGTNLHLLTIHFKGENEGKTDLSIEVTDLADSSYNIIGVPVGGSASVIVTDVLPYLGDVNGDGEISIVDALMTAQYSVGGNPQPFETAVADVNCDGSIDIVDALIIAQFYVGIINSFPC